MGRRLAGLLLAGTAFLAVPAAALALPTGDLPGSDLPPPVGPIVGAVDDIVEAVIDIVTGDPAGAPDEVIDLLNYTIRTEIPGAEGPVVRNTDATLLVPTPVDVDGDPTTGSGGAEMIVQLTVDAGRATLRATKTPGAPADLPIKTEAVLNDPRRQSDFKVAFGYDALAATAPAEYTATIALVGSDRLSSFVLDVATVTPGDTLAVIAEVFTADDDGARVDPQRGRIDLTPVPATTHIAVLLGSDLGLQQSGIDITVDRPTAADVLLADEAGSNTVEAKARIDKIPNNLGFTLTESSDGQQTLTYRATDRVAELTLDVVEKKNGDVTAQVRASLLDVPTNVVLLQDRADHATITTDGAIGVVEAGFASGGRVKWLTDAAYLHDFRDGDLASLAVRVLGLERAELTTSDPVAIDVTLAAGPFRILVEDGPTMFEANVTDLPHQLAAEFSRTDGHLHYVGSDPIAKIAVHAEDPEGIVERATTLDAVLTGLAREMTFTVDGGGAVVLDAHGGRVDLVEVNATSGPDVDVDDGFDGVVLEDVADHYALAARLTGLERVEVSTGAAPYTFKMAKQAGPFLVRLDEGSRTARVEIVDLPASFEATLDPAGSLTYTASSGIGLVTADVHDDAGLGGRATDADVRFEGLPQSLTVNYGSATGSVGIDANGGTLDRLEVLLTSGPSPTLPAGYDGIILEDVESHYALAVRLLGLRKVSVTTNEVPYEFELAKTPGPFLVRLDEGTRKATIEILDLPDSLAGSLDPAGSLTYEASSGIALLTADVTDPDGLAGRATAAKVRFAGLPTTLTVNYGTADGEVGIDAGGGTLAELDALVTSGPELEVPAGFDGIRFEDVPEHYVFAVRLRGLRKATVSTGAAPYHLLLEKAAGPFSVDLVQGTRVTTVRILDLPASLDASLDPSGALSYTASAAMGSITAEIDDPEGVSGRATLVRAALTSLPPALTINWAAANGQIVADARGGTIGSLDFLLTSGPIETLPAATDGVIFRDLTDRYVATARLTGLKKVTFTQASPPSFSLETVGGRPFVAEVDRQVTGGVATVDASISALPATVSLAFTGPTTIAYRAASPVSRVVFSASDPNSISGRAKRVDATLTGVPVSLDLASGTNGQFSANANGGVLGSADVLLTSGPVEAVPTGKDGVILRDLTDRYVAAVRLTGLRSVTFAQGPPPSFTLNTTGGRSFVVELDSSRPGGAVATIDAAIEVLPPTLSVNFSSPTTFAYRASAAVTSVTLDAFDPNGISGRANTLHGLLQSVPTSLDVSAGTTGTVLVDALGGTVGLVDFQLTSGPNDRVASGFDGVLLNDLADRYVVHARIAGLKKISGTVSSTPDITLNTSGGRPFKAELNRRNVSGKVEYTRATLLNLPATVNLKFVESGSKQEITYTANATATSLTLDTNAGDRWNLNASIANPVPTSVKVCQASDSACGGSGRSANSGSLRFDASAHTTVNLFDCTRPLNSSCTRTGSPAEYIRVDNLRVRYMNFDASASGSGESGHIYLDTNNHELTGFAKVEDGSTGLEAQFNSGFRSENRLGTWSVWGLFKNKSGTITCNGSLSIRVLGIWIGVTSYLC